MTQAVFGRNAKNHDLLERLRQGDPLTQHRAGQNGSGWRTTFRFSDGRTVSIVAIRHLERQGLVKIVEREGLRAVETTAKEAK